MIRTTEIPKAGYSTEERNHQLEYKSQEISQSEEKLKRKERKKKKTLKGSSETG